MPEIVGAMAEATRALRVGALDAYGPFGGFKNSGFEREGGTEALADYTESQAILLPAKGDSS